MLEQLKRNNPMLAIYSVDSEKFRPFGRVITDVDTSAILQAAEEIAYPEEGSKYLPSVESFEALELAKKIQDECFGTLPAQVGYCWGYNRLMNATEWHTSSEINIAVTDLVLILGHVWDIRDNAIDASQFKAFYLPKGTAVEVYATSLHYCPCQVHDSGFGCVVGLPQGTNVSLPEQEHDPLLFSRNKWLIAHNDNARLRDRGAVVGISGPNYEIKY